MSSPFALAVPAAAASEYRFWKDTVWVAVTNLSQATGPFLALLLLARWHGLEAAGHFAYALAITSPLAQLLNFQIKALILTHSITELPLSIAASIRGIVTIPVLLLICGLSVWIAPLSGLWMAVRLLDSWAEIFQANLQRSRQMAKPALSMAVRAAGLVIAICLAPSPAAAVGLYAGFSLLILLFLDWGFLPISLTSEWSALGTVFRQGLLLGVVLFMQAASASIPRIALERSSDAATLGLFSSLSVLLQIGNLLASAFGQSLIPRLPGASLTSIALWSGIPLLGAIAALALEQFAQPVLFNLLHIASSPEAREMLLSLGLAQLVVWPATMIGFALTARRRYNESLWIGATLLLVSTASSIFLVPQYGHYGAALSIAAVASVTLIMSFCLLAIPEPQVVESAQ